MRNWSLSELCPAVVPIHGEPLRYWVGSGSRAKVKHVVDLAENGGLGQCSCERWTFVVGPSIAAGVEPVACKHVAAAQRYLAYCVALKTVANSSRRSSSRA